VRRTSQPQSYGDLLRAIRRGDVLEQQLESKFRSACGTLIVLTVVVLTPFPLA